MIRRPAAGFLHSRAKISASSPFAMARLHYVLAGGLAAAMALNVCEAFVQLHHIAGLQSRSLGKAGAWDLRGAPACRVRSNVSPRSIAAAPKMDSQSKVSTAEEFWTRPRTTNANYGVFFEVSAKDKPIWITGLRAGGHSFATHDEYTRMKIRVLTADGSAVGKELDEKAWTLLGEVTSLDSVPISCLHVLTCSIRTRPMNSRFLALKLARLCRCIHLCRSSQCKFRRTLREHSASTRTEKRASLCDES